MAHVIAIRASRDPIVVCPIVLCNARNTVCAARANVYAVMAGLGKTALSATAPMTALGMVLASTSLVSATLATPVMIVLSCHAPMTALSMALASMEPVSARRNSAVLIALFLLASTIVHIRAFVTMGCAIAILDLRVTTVLQRCAPTSAQGTASAQPIM